MEPKPLDDVAIDRILASDDDVIEPSSGFAMATLRAVQEAAAEPPPFPFPWRRLVIGAAAFTVAAAVAIAVAPPMGTLFLLPTPLPAPLPQLARLGPELGYATIGIVASLGTIRTLLGLRRFLLRTLTD